MLSLSSLKLGISDKWYSLFLDMAKLACTDSRYDVTHSFLAMSRNGGLELFHIADTIGNIGRFTGIYNPAWHLPQVQCKGLSRLSVP